MCEVLDLLLSAWYHCKDISSVHRWHLDFDGIHRCNHFYRRAFVGVASPTVAQAMGVSVFSILVLSYHEVMWTSAQES